MWDDNSLPAGVPEKNWPKIGKSALPEQICHLRDTQGAHLSQFTHIPQQIEG